MDENMSLYLLKLEAESDAAAYRLAKGDRISAEREKENHKKIEELKQKEAEAYEKAVASKTEYINAWNEAMR